MVAYKKYKIEIVVNNRVLFSRDVYKLNEIVQDFGISYDAIIHISHGKYIRKWDHLRLTKLDNPNPKPEKIKVEGRGRGRPKKVVEPDAPVKIKKIKKNKKMKDIIKENDLIEIVDVKDILTDKDIEDIFNK
tara:strand:+ start:239 stop:634 length:396 start_codon:yes stop_codon:yes gene_type:complete